MSNESSLPVVTQTYASYAIDHPQVSEPSSNIFVGVCYGLCFLIIGSDLVAI